MQSTGKVPPSVINIESLHLYLGRNHGSAVIDALTTHEEYGTQYKVICQQSDVAKVTYLIQLRSGHFISNTATSEENLDSIDRNTEPSLRLSINLGLLNPLKIRTVIVGDVVFRLNLEMSRINRINPFVYDVFDSFLETKEYIYSGNNE